MRKIHLELIRILALVLLVVVLDQLSKYFVLYQLNLINTNRIEVIPGILNFHLAWNKGVNFGLFANDSPTMKYLLVGLATLIVGGMLWYAYRTKLIELEVLAFGFIIGGAIGNTIDRLSQGAVIDFLNMTCCGIYNPYSFNIADLVIFVGAGILLLFGFGKNDSSDKN